MPSYASILALIFAVSFVHAATPPSEAKSQKEPAETGRFVRSNVVELNTVGYLMPHYNQVTKMIFFPAGQFFGMDQSQEPFDCFVLRPRIRKSGQSKAQLPTCSGESQIMIYFR